MFVILALASAACYGAADFLGGLTSKRADTVAIVLLSQCTGLALLALCMPVVQATHVTGADLLWGGASGLTGGIGVGVLYYALSISTMAVVAPITAVCAVAIPVGAALLLGERPGTWTIAGIGIAVIAIVLLSRSADESSRGPRQSKGVALALVSGVLIGMFFLCLARTSRDSGLWPLFAARLVSVPLFAAIAVVGRRSLVMTPRVGLTAAAGGALDMLANLLYMVATHLGPLSVVVTLSSLYPASTVVLARVTLGERLTTPQLIGVVCAIGAVVMIVGMNAK